MGHFSGVGIRPSSHDTIEISSAFQKGKENKSDKSPYIGSVEGGRDLALHIGTDSSNWNETVLFIQHLGFRAKQSLRWMRLLHFHIAASALAVAFLHQRGIGVAGGRSQRTYIHTSFSHWRLAINSEVGILGPSKQRHGPLPK